MKYIFFLSGDYADLGKEEIISLFDIENFNSIGRLAMADVGNNEAESNKIFKRLAMAKSIYKHLFECNIGDLIDFMKNYEWNSVYKKNFCLRIERLGNNRGCNGGKTYGNNSMAGKYNNEKYIKNKFSEKSSNNKNNEKLKLKKPGGKKFTEKNLSGYIWASIINPKVNLESPKTLIQVYIIGNKAYCGLLIYGNKENFESRKSQNRPFLHPSSLHPKIAKALVNITGIKEKGILLDPFCGTGGFFIEAGNIGVNSVGYDINKIMIKGCIANLKHFKIRNFKIKRRNALKINDKFDYLVTDLPYGLNSNAISVYDKKNWKKGRINKKIQKQRFVKDLESFYAQFLKNLRKKLKKNAVIVFPHYVNYRKLLKQAKFKILKEFSNYVHGSLTRKIIKVR